MIFEIQPYEEIWGGIFTVGAAKNSVIVKPEIFLASRAVDEVALMGQY